MGNHRNRRSRARAHQKGNPEEKSSRETDAQHNDSSQSSPILTQQSQKPESPREGNQPGDEILETAHITNERLIVRWTKVVGIFTGALFFATAVLAGVS